MTFPGEFLLSTVVQSLINAALEPVARTMSQAVNTLAPTNLPQPNDLISLRFKGYHTKEQYLKFMRTYGYNDDVAESMYLNLEQRFAASDLVNLKRRGLIQPEVYKKLALENGLTEHRLPIMEQALEFYPNVGDLIRFAVREGYSPEIVQRFKLDEDLPAKYLEEAAKAGLSKENATLFWRSHWELPSVQEGYEMLHRGIITVAELELLLRTADISPYWRDKLIRIAQTPYTRVDVRRMYQLGVLTLEGVIRAYKDIGYDDEHAGKLAEFTIKDVMAEERDLTKSEIIKLYGYEELPREKAFDMLKGLGYDDSETNMILSAQDLKLSTADTTAEIKALVEQYTNELIEEAEFKEALAHLNLKAKAMERIFKSALIKRKTSKINLAKADISLLYKNELIDRQDAFDRLLRIHYYEDDAALLLDLIDLKRKKTEDKKEDEAEEDKEGENDVK